MTALHGRFIWYELVTTDRSAAAAFYTGVVGWGARDVSKPGMPYTLFTVGDAPVSGMLDLSENARRMGVTPSWIGYVGVDDVDVVTDRFKQLGGAVHVRPQDMLGMSRFSIVADPQRATLALFKWINRGAEQPPDLHARGHVGWHQLLADDSEKAWDFYREIFGWQEADAGSGRKGTQRMFSAAGQTIGNIFTKSEMLPVPLWVYYFNVGDINAAANRVRAAGGRILKGPTEAPEGQRIVQCTDPQGAVFALLGNDGIGYFERAAPRRDEQRTP
jgi:predicted enzyme related to lactoylglutathione lyase